MATYSTLEEIKTGMQDDLFADDLITLRSEQRDAIDQAKERFCKRSGRLTYTDIDRHIYG